MSAMGTPRAKVDDATLNAALFDQAERIARNDPDWGLYLPGDPRPRIPWWRRVLKL